MAGIHITDIEAAINYWRAQKPSPDGVTLCAELRALAEVYGLMVYFHEEEADEASMPPKAYDAWLAWYETTPDTPCIAICSTFQGDALCKALARHGPGRKARDLAPHHAGRRFLALQPLRRARRRRAHACY